MQHDTVTKAIGKMHSAVNANADGRHQAAINRHNKMTSVCNVDFSIGDYVLMGTTQPSKISKLLIRKTGSARVVAFTKPLIATVENFLDGKTREIHARRISSITMLPSTSKKN